jgi:mannose/fructose/N-acetylgalactosamine-specific phosphotransferase system component IIC
MAAEKFALPATYSIRWAIPLAVAIITLVVFWGVLRNGFVDWDDDRVLLENLNYRGLGWLNLQWMFTTFYKSGSNRTKVRKVS